jgi:hypothetical protein
MAATGGGVVAADAAFGAADVERIARGYFAGRTLASSRVGRVTGL